MTLGGGTVFHTVWKGNISFGLVAIPIKLHAATESKDVKFRYLHRDCNTPVEYQKVCPTCQKTVTMEEIVRGVEYSPGQFVVLSEEEMESTKKERADTIDIMDFVSLAEIDPVYFEKTYYLSADRGSLRAYRLLAKAMEDTQRIAVARTVLRSSETLACIRSREGVLIMETLYWPDEIRDIGALPYVNDETTVASNELLMAKQLIEQLNSHFQAENYRDERRETLLSMIEKKVEQEGVPQQKRDNVVDLMAALQASLKKTTESDQPKQRARKKQTQKTS